VEGDIIKVNIFYFKKKIASLTATVVSLWHYQMARSRSFFPN